MGAEYAAALSADQYIRDGHHVLVGRREPLVEGRSGGGREDYSKSRFRRDSGSGSKDQMTSSQSEKSKA